MRVVSLDELTPAEARTIIINVGTDLVATRALLSAVDLADMPVLLVNCDPDDVSTRHFDDLMRRFPFDAIDVPLRRHGDLLDRIFADTRDQQLLLLDSDAELRRAEFVSWMRSKLGDPRVFGAGFSEGPFWMPEAWSAPSESLLYMERPWVPCTLLRVDAVRRALAADRHFAERFFPNEVWFIPGVAQFLAARFPGPWTQPSRAFQRLPHRVQDRIRKMPLDRLRRLRRRYYGLRPKMAVYDTGGLVYEYLRFEEGLIFAGVDVELSEGEVHHYGGVTRSHVFEPMPTDVLAENVRDEVIDRLATRYGYTWHA